MKTATRNRAIIGGALLAVGAFIAYEMFFSLTPPRHADHDHAMATLDAGGFLWIRSLDGQRRNLVGRPGRVLVLHWLDPETADEAALGTAARLAAMAGSGVEVILVARAASPDAARAWAARSGLPPEALYLDPEGRTAGLIGVRRYPETLVYDPAGTLAYQAHGVVEAGSPELLAAIARARAGVGEID